MKVFTQQQGHWCLLQLPWLCCCTRAECSVYSKCPYLMRGLLHMGITWSSSQDPQPSSSAVLYPLEPVQARSAYWLTRAPLRLRTSGRKNAKVEWIPRTNCLLPWPFFDDIALANPRSEHKIKKVPRCLFVNPPTVCFSTTATQGVPNCLILTVFPMLKNIEENWVEVSRARNIDWCKHWCKHWCKQNFV